MAETIFESVHGSHLYGLAHAGSDRDVFRVTTSSRGRGTHRVAEDDVVSLGLERFVAMAKKGAHQSVEAMFSPMKVWNPKYAHLRAYVESHLIAGAEVFDRYERVLVKFAEAGDVKRRRHAVRLAMGLAQLRASGRLRPRLSESEVARVREVADRYEGDELAGFLLAGRA